MARGGARAHSGQPPDPAALRRDRDQKDWVVLPAAGRKGPVPKWPLSKATARELELWKEEWRRPQAVEWLRLGLQITVALYVRSLVGAEKPKAPVNLRTLVKQLQEELGISPSGLARLRWKIEAIPAAATTGDAPPARAPLQVVTGGAA